MSRRLHIVLGFVVVVALLAGCTSSSKAPPTTTTTRAPVTTTTTLPGVQTSGPRTVLSPIGLNVRQAPSKSAKVVASAAQGVAVTVTGHSVSGGGWYKVKGQTVAGWISADPSLSAPGTFLAYQSNPLEFTVLYPSSWTVTPGPLVLFKSPAAAEEAVSVRGGASVAALPHGLPNYSLASTQTVVACGVTTTMFVYSPVSGHGSLHTEVRIPVSTTHALGLDGRMPTKADLGTFLNFVNSITFASPQCAGA